MNALERIYFFVRDLNWYTRQTRERPNPTQPWRDRGSNCVSCGQQLDKKAVEQQMR